MTVSARTPEYAASGDFRSVVHNGRAFRLTRNQAAAVSVLWRAWLQGVPEVSDDYVIAEAGLNASRLSWVFRDKINGRCVPAPSWGVLVVPGSRPGLRRIAGSPPSSLAEEYFREFHARRSKYHT